jgi:glycosyltransferase involved in cell wall biosynthesis
MHSAEPSVWPGAVSLRPLDPPTSSTKPEQSAIESLERRLGTLEDQLLRLRELVIRAYEGTQGSAAQLLRVRRESSYEDAYAQNPLVTVRIGTYAGGEMLYTRALNSVLGQSYANWEAVIVVDGLDQSTAARVASLGDSRIRCVQRPRNGPYPTAAASRWQVAGAHPFNEAYALARGAWIAPIDQDDEWTTDHLEVLLATALNTRAEVVYGVGSVIVAGSGETYFGRWPPAMGDFGFQTAIHHAGLTSFLYDVNAHLIDEPADWNLARRMLEAGVRFDFVEQIVTNYYVEEGAQALGWWRDRLETRGSFSRPGPKGHDSTRGEAP